MNDPEKMTFNELHEWACGRLLLAIGKGEFRNELWVVMELTNRRAYQRGLETGKAVKP